jgi:hypothetical protein
MVSVPSTAFRMASALATSAKLHDGGYPRARAAESAVPTASPLRSP